MYPVPWKDRFIDSCVFALGPRICFFILPRASNKRKIGARSSSDHNNALIVGNTSFAPELTVELKGVIICVKIAVLTLNNSARI